MTTTIQVQVPLSLNDGELMLVKVVDVDYPPRPGDRVWDASFTDLMNRCGNVLAEAVVEESGVDIDENTVVIMCQNFVRERLRRPTAITHLCGLISSPTLGIVANLTYGF